MVKYCRNAYCKNCYPNSKDYLLEQYDMEEIMFINPEHPDDLEAMADAMEKNLEGTNEALFNQKLAAESDKNIEDEEVERMMGGTFDVQPKDDPSHIVLFRKDGEYGYVDFAGIFDDVERVLMYTSNENREVTIADSSDAVEEGDHLDYFLVDVSVDPVEILYGAKIVPNNAFVTIGASGA